ncbi:MAG: PTS sugar transporter subunit IIA [Megasphaera sp.]|jgi:PTS system galactitol-specific IIA component|nr:PTS sugar transporter subunit IIA [Megasphaera sp.]
MSELFRKDCIFISKQHTVEDIFKDVSTKLVEKDLVTSEFLPQVVEREKNYPTAVDLDILQKGLPNIAVPHTESAYVKARLVIPVKLERPVLFGNMISPDEKIKVSWLFMILNNNPDAQANVLAAVMDFVTKNDAAELQEFFRSDDTEGIYTYLNQHFIFDNK